MGPKSRNRLKAGAESRGHRKWYDSLRNGGGVYVSSISINLILLIPNI